MFSIDNDKNIYIALHCIALHCIALHCIALHCIALHCIALHCIALQCSAVQCSAVQYSTVQYSTVQYSTVQYSTVLVSRLPQMQEEHEQTRDGAVDFWQLLKQSTAKTGVQGMNNIGEARSRARRAFWAVVVVAGTGNNK